MDLGLVEVCFMSRWGLFLPQAFAQISPRRHFQDYLPVILFPADRRNPAHLKLGTDPRIRGAHLGLYLYRRMNLFLCMSPLDILFTINELTNRNLANCVHMRETATAGAILIFFGIFLLLCGFELTSRTSFKVHNLNPYIFRWRSLETFFRETVSKSWSLDLPFAFTQKLRAIIEDGLWSVDLWTARSGIWGHVFHYHR